MARLGALGYTPVNSTLIASQAQTKVFGHVPVIGSDGVIELGKYIDFHADSNSTVDYDVRLTASSGLLSCSTDFQTSGAVYFGSYKVYVG